MFISQNSAYHLTMLYVCYYYSYNDFDKNVGFGTINYFSNKTKKVIDFIFSNKSIKSSRIIDSEFNNVKFISDHDPVINIY